MYGKLEGLTKAEVRDLYSNWKELTEAERWSHKIHDEETNEELITRFMTYLRETALANPGKTILVVSHGGLLRTFLIKLAYGTFDEVGRIENCGYVAVESDGVDFFIKEVKGVLPDN